MTQEALLPPTLIASLSVGVFSLFARRKKDSRSSWPTWLIVPLIVLDSIISAVPTAPETTPLTLTLFFYGVMWFVLLRWMIALIYCEKGRGWIFYILLPFIAPASLEVISFILKR